MVGDKNIYKKANDSETAEDEVISQEQLSLLEAHLQAVKSGIKKGRSKDLSSNKGNILSIFHGIEELIVAPLMLSAPSRELEREVKGVPSTLKVFKETNLSGNEKAIQRFRSAVLNQSYQLYKSNFDGFIRQMEAVPGFQEGIRPLNDITNVKFLAINFNSLDLETPMFSRDSPYKVILKKIIPLFREKFDAIVSFEKSLNTLSSIEYKELFRLYKAICEWRDALDAFRSGHGLVSNKVDKKQETSDESSSLRQDGTVAQSAGDESETLEDIIKNIYVETARPGDGVITHQDDASTLYIDRDMLNSFGSSPVVKLYIKGPKADKINQGESSSKYVTRLIQKGVITINEDIDVAELIMGVSRETVSGGAEITLYLSPYVIKSLFSSDQTEREKVLEIQGKRRLITVFADSRSEADDLKKISSAESTPYYEADSPNGKVSFTPADLVIGGGKIKDSKGNWFKPKNIRGKSLAQKVNSKGFGRVRRKK
jgi:hypothetical protein|tara:strand:- start:2873 stop:4327 length:1455 start_codon:yes stop_codon:yes gene_type:complete